jgi:hypothetical protein
MSNDKLLCFRVLAVVSLAVLTSGCGGGEEESTGRAASDAAYTTSANQEAAAGSASPSASRRLRPCRSTEIRRAAAQDYLYGGSLAGSGQTFARAAKTIDSGYAV